MLKEFLQAISGPVSNIAFTYPSDKVAGGPTVSAGGVFNKLLKVISNGAYNGGGSNFLGGYTAMQTQQQNPAAVQAYLNSINSYAGLANPMKSKTREAFSPGSVVNSLQIPPAPQVSSDYFAQVGQLSAGVNPLQGFAGQNGSAIPGAVSGSLTGALGAGSLIPGQVLPGGGYLPGSVPGGSGFGKWSMFLMPLVGLLGAVKSIFSFRRGSGFMTPVKIDKEALAYKDSIKMYDKEENTEGSFDDSYWGEGGGEGRGENDFDPSKLEEI